MFSGSIVALVTPMFGDGKIDYQSLDRLLELHLAAGTDGLVILGSTGEGITITPEEKLSIISKTIKFIDQRIPVIVGVGNSSTQSTIDAAQQVADLAPDGLLVICPYYNRPTQEGLYLHFAALAKSVSVPIIMYNHPGRTGVDMLPETVARLAQLNNIVGLKEAVTTSERFHQLRKVCPADFLLFSGDDMTCLAFIKAGANGVISVAANIVPEQMQVMCQAALKDDFVLAQSVHLQLLPLFDALNVESNPIPLKWAMAEKNYIANSLRLPLTPLSSAGQSVVAAALKNLKGIL
jgi:4-hydroxy-tetrahydrodipicolinate synthase